MSHHNYKVKKIVKFKNHLLQDLKSFLLQDNYERHAFLFCNLSISTNSIIFLVDKIITINDKDIDHSAIHVRIKKELADNIFIDFTNSDYDGFISCHSHPFENADVWFSSVDDKNDKYLFSYFYDEIIKYKNKSEMLTMVFGQNTIASRAYNLNDKTFEEIDNIVSMEYPIKYFAPTNNKKKSFFNNNELFNRQVLAFGEEGQGLLSSLKVTLVGAGGTGSILSEALIRLGVKELIIIDHDKLEFSNLNRWQGGKQEDVEKYKVDIIKDNLSKINNTIKITTFCKTIYNNDVVDYIKDSDVIIGAIDNNQARYFLNRFSSAYLIPYLDCSTIITADKGKIKDLKIRNVIIIPSVSQCMDCKSLCYDISKLSYALSHNDTKEEAKKRKYIRTEDDIKSPSVYPINMLSVSNLLLEFMNVFMGYKDSLHQYTVINYIDLEKIGSKDDIKLCWNKEAPSKQCLTCNDYIALGDKVEISNLFFN